MKFSASSFKNIPSIVFLFFIFQSTTLFSQSPSIKGTIFNEQNEVMEYVSVVLLNPKDSTMVNYTSSDEKGMFTIVEGSKDSLIVHLFYTGYQPYYKNIAYQKKTIDLKNIILKEKIGTLNEVVISAVVPVQIKKDTIAFNANAFKVNYDDNIEELLKKLPGIEIASDGKVIAQGNEVTKIFVDGKEFFGGDPAIVLKNLPADAIAKIELIDKKSDESELTGVADGNKEVVINFTLKESKKNKGFGKLSAGIGLDNHYFGNLNYNLFSKKTQLSAIGKFNNINITGANIQDFLKNADGIADDSDEDNSNSKPRSISGFLTTAVGGVNFGREFKKRESFNSDYFYNFSDNYGKSDSKRTTFSNSRNFNSTSENNFSNTTEKHNLNYNYENKSSKTRSLIVKGKINSENRNSTSDRDVAYFNTQNLLSTTNKSNFNNQNLRKFADVQANYYQKLSSTGRSFNGGIYASTNSSDLENYQNTFIVQNISSGTRIERNISTSRNEYYDNKLVNLNFKYTEPIKENHYLRFESRIVNKKESQDVNQAKVTTVENVDEEEALVFDYNYIETDYKTKMEHSYNSEKLNIYTGIELENLDRKFGEIGAEQYTTTKATLNPNFSVQFTPKNGRKYKLRYNRSLKSPSANQSSTVINDLNPYFIRKGNPDLIPEVINNINFFSAIHNLASSQSFYANATFQHTSNAIIQNISIDDDFVKTSSYDNSGNRIRLNTAVSYSSKFPSTGLRFSIKNKNSFNTSNSIINLELNDVTSKDFTNEISLENYNKNKIDVKVGASVSINNTDFSIKKDLNREYVQQRYYSAFDIKLNKKLNANTQLDYFIYNDSRFQSDQKIPLWNSAISYAFNSNNIMKLIFIDLLNKNIDIDRRSSTNYFEETTTKSLGRYIIISYTYRLNNGMSKKNKSSNKKH